MCKLKQTVSFNFGTRTRQTADYSVLLMQSRDYIAMSIYFILVGCSFHMISLRYQALAATGKQELSLFLWVFLFIIIIFMVTCIKIPLSCLSCLLLLQLASRAVLPFLSYKLFKGSCRSNK